MTVYRVNVRKWFHSLDEALEDAERAGEEVFSQEEGEFSSEDNEVRITRIKIR